MRLHFLCLKFMKYYPYRMRNFFNWLKSLNPRVRIAAGIVCIILGFLALVTPLTPGSWLILIGFELLGLEFLTGPRIDRWLKRRKDAKADDSVDTTQH